MSKLVQTVMRKQASMQKRAGYWSNVLKPWLVAKDAAFVNSIANKGAKFVGRDLLSWKNIKNAIFNRPADPSLKALIGETMMQYPREIANTLYAAGGVGAGLGAYGTYKGVKGIKKSIER